MKPGGGKQKGAAFERKVCEQLSRFIVPGTNETLFWRSAMSGGRATVRHKQGKKGDDNQAGDITCVHEAGRWLTEYFVIECKFYSDLDIEAFILSNKGKLAKFWNEVRLLAKRHKKTPMLIAKQNRTKTLLLLTTSGVNSFDVFRVMPLPLAVVYNAHMYGYEEVICP